MPAQAFIEQILLQALRVKHLIVGDDFRFGCDRSGDYRALAAAGQQHGFQVQDSPTLELDSERVSSTRVRTELSANNLSRVAHLLGRPYRMSGRVAFGRQLGRQLDTPTANVMVNRRQLPLNGVFAVQVTEEESGRRFSGVANCGIKPTVAGVPEPSLEVHLFDFSGNLYHRHLTVEFVHKLREEQKFAGLAELQQAIAADKQAARQYFAARAAAGH